MNKIKLNEQAKYIVQGLEDELDLSSLIDPNEEMPDEVFKYLYEVVSNILTYAALPEFYKNDATETNRGRQ